MEGFTFFDSQCPLTQVFISLLIDTVPYAACYKPNVAFFDKGIVAVYEHSKH